MAHNLPLLAWGLNAAFRQAKTKAASGTAGCRAARREMRRIVCERLRLETAQ